VESLRENWRKVHRLPTYWYPLQSVAKAMLPILWPLSVDMYTVLLLSSKLPSFCHWWMVTLKTLTQHFPRLGTWIPQLLGP